ncbi:MFS transporter [Duganella sp. sic0402]|uniref:MFS transporter n=1 Tax=Duganella sp. sic0402 TaxID=2854786 RepID=UPI001C44C104|nr:MFS transporter [Duganella sp. sic0402]MBV7534370.1 MFS transporter [Duganella sp. sic0402]
MQRSLVLLFACASGLSVANVYYAQPLLDALAADFGISHAAVGGVITAAQAGSALALLLLVPLGDLLPRRRLMLGQLAALVAALAGVCLARSATALLLGMLAVGMLGTAMTQGLIAYAASAAAEDERGRVVGAAQSGVVAGLLLARVFAGWVADLAGWRGVYAASAALMLILMLLLWRALPNIVAATGPGTASGPLAQAQARSAASEAGEQASAAATYASLLASMLTLLRHNRVLQVRGAIALLMFAVFGVFWNTLVFLLGAPPYAYSHTAIGAFGLVGLAGALAAARAGHWADRGRAQQASGAALLLMLFSWLPLALAPQSLAALILGIVALDLGVQALHVTNQSLILRGAQNAHSRLIGAYMMFYAAGSAGGAIAATSVYAQAGWNGVCLLGGGLSLMALAVWASTTKVASPDCKSGRTNLEWPDQINVLQQRDKNP